MGQYVPQSGDIVFFNNNTAGIVAEVYKNSFNVICGDVQNAVASNVMSLSDSSIIGWGSTAKSLSGNLTGNSNRPTFFIVEGGEPQVQMQRFSLRATRSITELIPYLEANGGSYFYTLLDMNNVELPKDADGNYIAEAQKGYKLTLTFNSPKGFLPGTYQYQIPNGLMVDGGNGDFVLKDGTNVGSWEVTDTGLITLIFNDKMNSRTDITISSTLGIHFPEQDDPIDFDGFITVKVEPPIQQSHPTDLSKWGTSNADAGKLNWYVLIKGRADSHIPGSILTDQVTLPEWGKPHSYIEFKLQKYCSSMRNSRGI